MKRKVENINNDGERKLSLIEQKLKTLNDFIIKYCIDYEAIRITIEISDNVIFRQILDAIKDAGYELDVDIVQTDVLKSQLFCYANIIWGNNASNIFEDENLRI
jgi:hypothetical protein